MGPVAIRPMVQGDVEKVLDLWFSTEGLLMRTIDTASSINAFLERNPSLSFVAEHAPDDGGEGRRKTVGAVICGQDGRRGYLHHLAVDPQFRNQGIGKALSDHCLAALRAVGITKCHLFVRVTNPEAVRFWERAGWHMRDDTHMLSRNLTEDLNA